MRTYARILHYAGPWRRSALYYLFAILLSIFFGLATYGLVIPLLKILFNQEELNHLLLDQQYFPKPHFDIHYLTKLFNYCFISIIIHQGKIGALFG
ncbi:ABC transporter ATP-binding protein, partial [Candidatus Cardinium hertigii]